MGKKVLGPYDVMRYLVKIIEIKTIADVVVERGGQEVDIRESVDFRYREWTLFKLIAHLLYVPLYTSIIKRYFVEYYYIDLFAGSGMGYLERGGRRIRIAGSSLIALSFAKPQFTKIYLNDAKQRKIKLLMERIKILSELPLKERKKYGFPLDEIDMERIKPYTLDANRAIEKIMSEIEERNKELLGRVGRGCHIYAFIDPEGLELEFKSLERILTSPVRSDLMILFNSYGVAMQVHNHFNSGYSDDAVRRHLGEGYYDYLERQARQRGKALEQLTVDELDDILTEFYAKEIERHGYKTVTIRLSLRDGARSPGQEREFNLIYATRSTKRNNPYMAALDYIKELVESPARYMGYGNLIDDAVYYLETGGLRGLLKDIIERPEEFFKRYSTSARFGGPAA